jgi:hypothetical protein
MQEALAELVAEIDSLEAAANGGDPGRQEEDSGLVTKSGAKISGISDAGAITFTSGLARSSAIARAFCSSRVFQDAAHDILNCDNVRLYHDQAVRKICLSFHS